MKTISFLSILFASTHCLFAQLEKADIEGAITISNSATNTPDAGTIRWTGTDFEGWDGAIWNSLTSGNDNQTPSGANFAFPFAAPPTGYLICDGKPVSRSTYSNLFALLGTTYGAGNGSTTFNLPNYNGQFLRGWDGGQGVDPDAATRLDRGDGVMGDVVGTKQKNQTELHNHTVNPPATSTSSSGTHTHSVDPPSTSTNTAGNHRHSWSFIEGNQDNGDATGWFDSAPNSSNQGTKNIFTNFAGSHTHALNIPTFNSGSSGNHTHSVDIPQFNSANHGGNETRPTNISVLWCIKY